MTGKYTPRVAFVGRRDGQKVSAPNYKAFWAGFAAACAILVPAHEFDVYFRQMRRLAAERDAAYQTAKRLFGKSEQAVWYYQHRNGFIKKAEAACVEAYPRAAAFHQWTARRFNPPPQRVTVRQLEPEDFPGHGAAVHSREG